MKKYLLTGLIILAPLVLTVLLIRFFIRLVIGPFLTFFSCVFEKIFPVLQTSPFLVFVVKIFLAFFIFFMIYILGVLARGFFFKKLIHNSQKVLLKIPFVRSIFHFMKSMIQAIVTSQETKAFVKPVLLAFPSKKSLAVGFLLRKTHVACQEKVPFPLSTVFIPTTPYPISGFLLFVPKEELKDLSLTNEEAFQYIISCGMVPPKEEKKS